MAKDISVVIADDHQLLIDGMKALLSGKKGIQVIGEANNGRQLLELCAETTPDVILLDINMPEMDGVQAIRQLTKVHPELRILVVSSHDDSRLVRELWKLGAHGYILKTGTSEEEMVKAIRILSEGGSYFSEEIEEKLRRVKSDPREESQDVLPISLTKREKEILKLIAMEYTGSEIAAELHISLNTVETHRKNLYRKTGVRSSAGLVKYALKHDLI